MAEDGNYVPYGRWSNGRIRNHISEFSDQSVPKPVFVWEIDRYYFSFLIWFLHILESSTNVLYTSVSLVQHQCKKWGNCLTETSNCTILSFFLMKHLINHSSLISVVMVLLVLIRICYLKISCFCFTEQMTKLNVIHDFCSMDLELS